MEWSDMTPDQQREALMREMVSLASNPKSGCKARAKAFRMLAKAHGVGTVDVFSVAVDYWIEHSDHPMARSLRPEWKRSRKGGEQD